MKVIRFKEEVIDAIRTPVVLKATNPITHEEAIGHYKTKTTRMTPRKDDEYEVAITTGWPWKYQKMGIIIEMIMVEPMLIKDYCPYELLSDVGHMDRGKFLETLNKLNAPQKVDENTKVYLHTFRVIEIIKGGGG
jgi:hypothetical protein